MGCTAQPIEAGFPDYQGVQTPIEWRSWTEEPGGLRVAPRGRKGLWDAMARAATALAIDPAPAELEPDEGAHLAYLARLAPTDADQPSAEVIDLAAYRSRRR